MSLQKENAIIYVVKRCVDLRFPDSGPNMKGRHKCEGCVYARNGAGTLKYLASVMLEFRDLPRKWTKLAFAYARSSFS